MEQAACPFCGNMEAEEFSVGRTERTVAGQTTTVYNATCSCGAHGPDADSRDAAIRRWNSWPMTVAVVYEKVLG